MPKNKLVEGLHDPREIARLKRVAEGIGRAQVFLCAYEPPVVVFEQQQGKLIADEQITDTERFLGELLEDQVVYDGLLDPWAAHIKARTMIVENQVMTQRAQNAE
jgi:hypothetical protein